MSNDQLSLQILTERPVVRNDEPSDIDLAIDLTTSKRIGAQKASYALNLCIVIDRSGSMEGEKLEQAKASCIEIFESLNPNDKFTVLAFDTDVLSVVNPQTPRNSIRERIRSLEAGGSTDLSKGFYLGLLELQTYASDRHINRLVLLSDGQANQGEQKPTVLGAESGRARDALGITTSTIGIGKDFQEDILAALAHASGGRFWFIGEARIEDIVKEEFSGALSVFLERPRVELNFGPGVAIVKELNDLPKISGSYRLRPIKANDQFCFALRVRIDPTKVEGNRIQLGASLLDGAGIVTKTDSTLVLGSVEEYVQSPENLSVATVVTKYLTTISDEKIAEEMGSGSVTTMLKMIESQSALMKELEAKLAGATAVPMDEQQSRELARCRMEIEENSALTVVGELVDLMQGLGRTNDALALVAHGRKHHKQRQMRNDMWAPRHAMDDWSVAHLLANAAESAAKLISEFPHLRDDIEDIRRRIREQLARFR